MYGLVMRKPKPTIIIREESVLVSPATKTRVNQAARQFFCADDGEAAALLRQLRRNARVSDVSESTFYTGRITWSEGYR